MFKRDIELASLLETVNQAKSFLFGMNSENYQTVLTPHFASSAGAHMRHIIDHYLALQDGIADGVINYNKRNRHSNVESCPTTALNAWDGIERWLNEVSQTDGDLPLSIVCETSVNETKNTQTQSTLARELVFVSSHAIHHFSLLAVISSLLGDQTESSFGVAPSTATYIRQQA